MSGVITWLKGEYGSSFTYGTDIIGSVEFRTNGFTGGELTHHAFLEVIFDTSARSTLLDVSVDERDFQQVGQVKLTFRGDGELEAAIQSFQFLADKLRGLLDKDI